MICNKCGKNNADDARFCLFCGASLSQPGVQHPNIQYTVLPQAKKTKFDYRKLFQNKKLLMGAAGAVLVVVVLMLTISIIGSLTKTSLYIAAENEISSVYSPDTEKTSIFFNNTLLSSQINGTATKVSSSANGNVAAFISEENTLYIVEKNTVQKIADDITDATLSYDGSVMAYTNEDHTLYTIQLRNKKIEKIADDTAEGNLFGIIRFPTLSPDGNTIMYVTEEDDGCVYLKTGSTTTKLEDFLGLFTSNSGKTIYGFGYKDGSYDDVKLEVYDISTDSTMKLSNGCDDLLFNSCHTEILFSLDSRYYLSIEGGERIKIGNYSYLRPLLPDNACGMESEAVSAANSFIGTLLVYCEDETYGIGYIDENYEMQRVIKNIGSYPNNVYITEDYNTIYYIRNDNLYMATRKQNFESEKLISDVLYYKVFPDGKKIYYVNSEYELLCRFKEEDTVIAQDVFRYSLRISDKGTVFFLADYSRGYGILYRCEDGKNKIRIADDVSSVFTYPGYIKYYIVDYEDNESTVDIYISTNGKDFNKVAEDVKTMD